MDQYFNLGDYSREITTNSKKTKLWFDRGLNWCYGFNHEEGVACFKRALTYDPNCAMAHWGMAFGSGPFYNLTWHEMGKAEADKYTKICFDSIQRAKSLVENITEVEADIIKATVFRFQKPHSVSSEEFKKWDDDYANALRDVYQKYPDDQDVMALFAEALITRTSWKLWDIYTGKPAENSWVLEAIEVLKRAIKIAKSPHPAILHLFIHATEMSETPEDALEAANILGTLCPDAGHLNHMPGHTYVLCGLYEETKIASEKAIRADEMFVNYAGPFNFYTTSRCHDLHLMMYGCMLLGQYAPAIKAAYDMRDTLTQEVLRVKGRPKLAVTMEGYYSMIMHVLVRFGRWQDIINTPMPPCPELYAVTTPMHHYAKAVAHATLGNFDEADAERSSFYKAFARVPNERKFFNNFATDTLSVGESMMEGEVEYHKGNHQVAFDHLREAVRRDDNLAYTEPWAWMHPPRHALGALLMEQGHYNEAEDVYRADLGLDDTLPRCKQHRDNVWALHGLAECLKRRGADEEFEALSPKLISTMSKTDQTITSSCCCRKKTEVIL